MSLRLTLLPLAVSAALLVPAAAAASVHVPRGQTVQDLKVIGQSIRVDGRALHSVIVVGGNLVVGPTGQVANVTVIGGRLQVTPGARLSGDVYQFGGGWPVLEGWKLVAVLVLLLAVRSLLVWLIVAAATVLARRTRMQGLLDVVRARPLRTLLVGLLAGAGLAALAVLLAITVFGLLVTAALLGLLLLATVAGVALALAPLQSDTQTRRLVLVALAIPLIGDALAAVATMIGLGALLRYAGLPRQRPAAAPAPWQ